MMIIYETRNLVNGKVYRGQHICGRRCQTGCKYLGSGEALKRAIEKYGRHNFRRRILAYATYPSVLNDLEKIYVTDDFVARQDTYNQITGGGSSGIPGAETREKMSAATSALMTPAWRKKISAATSASMTPARRKKISAALKGKKHNAERCATNSAAHTGMVIPPKVRKKMSAAVTPKMRAERSAAMTGKEHTAEAREKMSASAIARYAVPGQREKTGAASRAGWIKRKARLALKK